jgi:hypothetical protein
MDYREERTSYNRAELKELFQQHMRFPVQNIQNKSTSQTTDGRSSPTSGSQRSSIPITYGRSNSAGSTRLQGEAGPSSSVPISGRERQGKEFVQRDYEPEAELINMIGNLVICSFSQVRTYKTMFLAYLTDTGSEDWDILLEVCERASATEAGAKEALRALRREFKYDPLYLSVSSYVLVNRYGKPIAQFHAARVCCRVIFAMVPLINCALVVGHHVAKFINNIYKSVDVTQIPRYVGRCTLFSKNVACCERKIPGHCCGCRICKRGRYVLEMR